MLRIARRDFERICAQALAEYPHECCGLLVEKVPGGVSDAHACTNVQQQRYEEDSQHYPRDASMAYLIDAGEQLRIAEAAEKAGGRVSGCYHSHIDCAAYFSDEDEKRTWIFNNPRCGRRSGRSGRDLSGALSMRRGGRQPADSARLQMFCLGRQPLRRNEC